MGTPLGPKYIPYTYMDPLGLCVGKIARIARFRIDVATRRGSDVAFPESKFRVWGLGFRVWGLGFRV